MLTDKAKHVRVKPSPVMPRPMKSWTYCLLYAINEYLKNIRTVN